MDKKILGGIVLLLLIGTFVSAAIIDINPPLPGQAVVVASGQSIIFYLKTINANLISASAAPPATAGALGGTAVTPITLNQDKTCNPPVNICPTGLAAKVSKNLEVIDKGGVQVFKASLASSGGEKGYIGQYFSIDLSSLSIDNKGVGLNVQNFPHSKYVFTLSAVSSNSRFLFFDVKKSDGKSLDCQNIFDSTTVVSELKSTWQSIKTAGWKNLWLSYVYTGGPLIFDYATTGSVTGYSDALFSRLMKVDLGIVPVTVSCTNTERPQIDSARAADLRVNVIGIDDVKKAGDPLVVYFTLDALKKESTDEYYSTLPASATTLFPN